MKELRQLLLRLQADLGLLERRISTIEKRLGMEPSPPGDELGRRRAARKKGLLKADYGTGKGLYSDIATDISEGGLRLETSQRHQVGLRLDLVLDVPQMGTPLKVKGEIVRVSELGQEGGFPLYVIGIRFLPMDDWTQRMLKDFVASLPEEKTKTAFEDKEKADWLAKLKDAGL